MFCCVVFCCCPYLWSMIYVICLSICLLTMICLWCSLNSCLTLTLVCSCTSLWMFCSCWVFCLLSICLCCLIGIYFGCLWLNICRCRVIWFCLLTFLCYLWSFWNFCKIRGSCFLSFCLVMICSYFCLWMRICLLVVVCLWNLLGFVCRSWFFCLCLDFFACLSCLWSSCCLLSYSWNLLVFFLLLFHLLVLLFGIVCCLFFLIFVLGFLFVAISLLLASFLVL